MNVISGYAPQVEKDMFWNAEEGRDGGSQWRFEWV